MRKRVALPIAILASTLLGSSVVSAQNAQMAPGHAGDRDLRQAMRKLWAEP